MKIVLSHVLLNASQELSTEICSQFGITHSDESADTFPEHTSKGLTIVNDRPTKEVVIDINDDMLIECMHIYVKIARFAGPVFKAWVAFTSELKADLKAIEAKWAA